MVKFLLLFWIVRFVVSLRNEFMTTEEHHMSVCLRTVLQHHCISGKPLLVSQPATSHDVAGTLPHADHVLWTDFLLGNIHEETLWPLYVSRGEIADETATSTPTDRPHSYILFTGSEDEDGDVVETLVGQLEAMKSSSSWNPRGRFVVMVKTLNSESPHSIALKISETMWNMNKIVNIVILIPNVDESMLKDSAGGEVSKLDVYTWFPYRAGSCAEPTEVVLLDHCLLDGKGKLSKDVSFFPSKVPNNLNGCPLRVATRHYEPYVILTDNITDANGTTTYSYRGLNIEYIRLFSEATNMTVDFLPPAGENFLNAHFLQLVGIIQGSADIAAGRFHLHPTITPYADPTTSFLFDIIRWYVPCPRPVSKMEKVLGVFSSSVWLCMAVVFILTSFVFWRSANGPHTSVVTESKNFKDILSCVYVVWCVLMGVSVPEMPITWKLRTWFLYFVWYCFAMNTVFQAFFISFLVEPGYNKPIETFDELKKSSLSYCLDKISEHGHFHISYYEYQKFDSSRMDLRSLKECLEYFFTNDNITLLSSVYYTQFIASLLGLDQNRNKLFCTLDQDEYSLHTVIYFSQGHPLLHRFNLLLRRSMESGLVEKYWSQLNFKVFLRNVFKAAARNACSETYFALSLFHLRIAFVVLGLGYVLSTISLLIELLINFNPKYVTG
jgi:hypothetical protein